MRHERIQVTKQQIYQYKNNSDIKAGVLFTIFSSANSFKELATSKISYIRKFNSHANIKTI